MVSPGTRLGGYEVLALIGSGGMGEVYRARDPKLNREVALKILPAEFTLEPDRLARFKREAQVLASLNHPNIAAIYGFEDTDGTQALVLELVEGPTLADRLSQGAIPLDDALGIAKQIAEALEAAHERGIVHRDLKPANVKVRSDGAVKVLDFGLAKAMEPAVSSARNLSQSPTITTPAMTQLGVILGTAGYMSPEQAKGLDADQRSDIFAFGCILYELLSGRPAFQGETVSEILASVLKLDVDMNALPPRLNPRLVELLRRCLAKNPKQRWHSAADLRIEIESLIGGALISHESHSAGSPAPPLWKRVAPVTAALLMGGLLAGYVTWRLKPERAPSVTRFPIFLEEGQRFTNMGRHFVALSPDGSRLVYIANQRLYVRSMSSLQAHAILGSDINGSVVNVVFSPDGQSVAFFSPVERALKRLAIAGGVPITICPAPDPLYGISWDEHGIVFGQGGRGILRVSPEGGTPEVIVQVSRDQVASEPQMLPGGRTVLFTVKKVEEGWEKAQVAVQSLDTGARKTLVEGSEGRYLPTGHLVYVLGGVLVAVPFKPQQLAITGTPVSIVEGIRRGGLQSGAPGTAQFDYSRNGTLVYVPGPVNPATGGDWDLALFDTNGNAQPLKLPPAPYRTPRASPDGKSIAVATDDGKEEVIWVYDVTGRSPLRRLTFGGKNRVPIWSPDGRWIAFQSDREGDVAIFRQRADGSSGNAERLTKPEAGTTHSPQAWSPDGTHLLVTVYESRSDRWKNGQFTLWMMSLGDRLMRPFGNVRSADQIEAAFSPDGRWVAYQSREPGITSTQVYLQPFPGAETKYLVPQTGANPFWLARRGLLILAQQFESFAIPVATAPRVMFGRPTTFPRGSRFEGPVGSGPRWVDAMPDGDHVIGVMSITSASDSANASQIVVVLNWSEELKQRVPTK